MIAGMLDVMQILIPQLRTLNSTISMKEMHFLQHVINLALKFPYKLIHQQAKKHKMPKKTLLHISDLFITSLLQNTQLWGYATCRIQKKWSI